MELIRYKKRKMYRCEKQAETAKDTSKDADEGLKHFW